MLRYYAIIVVELWKFHNECSAGSADLEIYTEHACEQQSATRPYCQSRSAYALPTYN